MVIVSTTGLGLDETVPSAWHIARPPAVGAIVDICHIPSCLVPFEVFLDLTKSPHYKFYLSKCISDS